MGILQQIIQRIIQWCLKRKGAKAPGPFVDVPSEPIQNEQKNSELYSDAPQMVEPQHVELAPGAQKPHDPWAAPWMDIASRELGVSEFRGDKHNPRVVEYHSATSLGARGDETPWCSAFACWVLKKAGYKTTRSAWARSWLEYGLPIPTPRYGCIAVYERNAPGGDSHVCFWVGRHDGDDWCLGGNQGDQVKHARQDRSKLLGYRWPIK
jgi:uncharacterized protein (TIGR02594 family)